MYFHGKLLDLQKKFSRWNPRKVKERATYLAIFSGTNWTNLPLSIKAEHSLMNCEGCVKRYTLEQSLFPVKSNQFINAHTDTHISTSCKQGAIVKAMGLYNEANTTFQESYKRPLSKDLAKVPELKLPLRKSKAEQKIERRNVYRKIKANVEMQLKDTEVVRYISILVK